MAVLMWAASVMLMTLLVLIGPRRTRVAGPAPMLAAQPVLVEAPPARPNPRVAVQTSAALLAIALALDVSSTPQALPALVEADGVYSALAVELYVLSEAAPQAWTPIEMASDWAYKAVNAVDGWLI